MLLGKQNLKSLLHLQAWTLLVTQPSSTHTAHPDKSKVSDTFLSILSTLFKLLSWAKNVVSLPSSYQPPSLWSFTPEALTPDTMRHRWGDGREFGPGFRRRPPSAKNKASGTWGLESCGLGGLDGTRLPTVLTESQEVKFSSFLFIFTSVLLRRN